ncbi:MAG: hypothetical protein ABJA66_12810 [Actinomycetota bacterium]
MNIQEVQNKPIIMICYWCQKPMPLSNQSKVSVCQNCHKLLKGAGLADKEIYQGDLTIANI